MTFFNSFRIGVSTEQPHCEHTPVLERISACIVETLGQKPEEHLSVLIYFVDEVAKVKAILPELLTMVTDGLVEAHPTEVLKSITIAEKVLS
jgi:hypothetical protein